MLRVRVPRIVSLATAITGTGSATLGSLTGASTGVTQIAGAGTQTLANLSGAASSTLFITGVSSQTLGNLTGSSTGVVGTPPIIGTASVTLDTLTNNATSKLLITGVQSVSLNTLTGAASGTIASAPGSCPTASEIATAVWSHVLENGITSGQMLRGITRTQMGKVLISGNTVIIRDLADTKDVVTAETDGNGQRTTVTVDWT